MDYTKLPRKLIYRDRKELEEFGVQNAESLEGRMFMEIYQMGLVGRRHDSERWLLNLFNDAYYILTIVLLEKLPYLRMTQILKIARTWDDGLDDNKKATVVMSMVLRLLDNCILNDQLEEFYRQVTDIVERYDEPKYIVKSTRTGISLYKDNNRYGPRIITKECLEGIEWDQLTDDYDPETIDSLVSNLAKTDHEMILLRDAINSHKKPPVESKKISKSFFEFIYDVNKDNDCDKVIEVQHHVKDSEVSGLKAQLDEKNREIDELKQKLAAMEQAVKGFTNGQMSVLFYYISLMTEENPPSKVALAPVISKITGYKETAVNQKLKGSFSPKDVETVAKTIEEVLPDLAKKIRGEKK